MLNSALYLYMFLSCGVSFDLDSHVDLANYFKKIELFLFSAVWMCMCSILKLFMDCVR